MESIVNSLVKQFETGSLSRRDLVRSLTILAAGGTAARAAEASIDFKTAQIDHVSMQVADLQRSADFYQRMFGFSMVSEDKPLGILRLGNGRTLVSFNRQAPVGIVDHFSIGVPNFTKEAATRYLESRGARVYDDPYAGLHVKDPDGINVQVSQART